MCSVYRHILHNGYTQGGWLSINFFTPCFFSVNRFLERQQFIQKLFFVKYSRKKKKRKIAWRLRGLKWFLTCSLSSGTFNQWLNACDSFVLTCFPEKSVAKQKVSVSVLSWLSFNQCFGSSFIQSPHTDIPRTVADGTLQETESSYRLYKIFDSHL